METIESSVDLYVINEEEYFTWYFIKSSEVKCYILKGSVYLPYKHEFFFKNRTFDFNKFKESSLSLSDDKRDYTYGIIKDVKFPIVVYGNSFNDGEVQIDIVIDDNNRYIYQKDSAFPGFSNALLEYLITIDLVNNELVFNNKETKISKILGKCIPTNKIYEKLNILM